MRISAGTSVACNLYKNDLDNNVGGPISKFAGYMEIGEVERNVSQRTQQYTDQLEIWTEEWQL